MRQLADVLLRGPGALTLPERELIAVYVSQLNDCSFCVKGHGARAAAHLGGNEELVRDVMCRYDEAEISGKLKALLAIAGKVQQGGKQVSVDDVARARHEGATDFEIHDAVLLAAAFCMYNRYIDGLGASDPDDVGLPRERK